MEGQANNPSGATITIAQEQYNRLRKDKDDALSRAEELRQELVAERALTEDERVEQASKLIEAFKTITDHHCANLAPEHIRDIPMEAYIAAANLVDKVVGATQRDSERAGVWLERAELVQVWRDHRKARGWGETADPTPPAKTPADVATKVAPLINVEHMDGVEPEPDIAEPAFDAEINGRLTDLHSVNHELNARTWAKDNGFKLVKYAKRGRKPAAKTAAKATKPKAKRRKSKARR